MKFLQGNEEKEAVLYLKKALEVTKESTCGRAHCGAVIVKQSTIIGRGFNSPPKDLESQRRCHRKNELPKDFKSDMTCCIHAEVRAINDALLNNPKDLSGSRIYFMRRTVDNEITKSGDPYCTICSKAVLDAGIKEFVLWQEKGIALFGTEEYNDLSFASDRRR